VKGFFAILLFLCPFWLRAQTALVIDREVVFDFRVTPPVVSGSSELASLTHFDTTGVGPKTHRAFLNLGERGLHLTDGAWFRILSDGAAVPGLFVISQNALIVDAGCGIESIADGGPAGKKESNNMAVRHLTRKLFDQLNDLLGTTGSPSARFLGKTNVTIQ